MFEVLRYRAADGSEPFSEWLASLKDKQAQAKVRLRIQRIATGNLGDSRPAGGGVREMREHDGPGYRVYFAQHGKSLVLLLCGGTKKSQDEDIRMARLYWADWKRRQP
ncbi:MAG: type II toxin-antitoxin system RelE/ParE family toxin [Betaproteobacteria bacterium]|nr:type II toxin-antitoxin system RelE/ParE family toxin [Betaproteobacteria bacterium]